MESLEQKSFFAVPFRSVRGGAGIDIQFGGGEFTGGRYRSLAAIRVLQFPNVMEELLLHEGEVTGEISFPDGQMIGQLSGGDVVDILDQNDVPLQVVQIFDERAVPAGAEEGGSVLVSKETVLPVDRQGVGRSFLFRKTDVEANRILLFRRFPLAASAMREDDIEAVETAKR